MLYIPGGAQKEPGIPSNTQFRESKTSEKLASLMNPSFWPKCGDCIKVGSLKELSCCVGAGPVGGMFGFADTAATRQ